MSDEEKPPYDVGYGKPPPQTRFQTGQSGNPKGRPKGVKNFATAIEQELNTRVAVNENGQRKLISKRVAIAKQLTNKAGGGDLKAIQTLTNIAGQHERQSAAEAARGWADLFAAPEDTMVMETILQRVRKAAGVPPGAGTIAESAAAAADSASDPAGAASDAPPTEPTAERDDR